MTSALHKRSLPSSRILALDYLRGFFIIVIIADHLWRWPSMFEYVSGRGELWSSAAQGFVIISGLLVGYVRGFKSRQKPLATVSSKLITRGLMLYLWMIITSLILVAASWTLTFRGSMAYIPINTGDWSHLITSVIRLDYVHTLTHFLYLYAIFLVISPLAVWLLRRGQAWVVAATSVVLWYIGTVSSIEWLQWQVLFFIPVVAGYYFEAILKTYHSLAQPIKHLIRLSLTGFTILTVSVAAAIILPNPPGEYQSTLFGREPITFATLIISFLWFGGLLSLFQYAMPILKRYVGWLLLTFGERSLTAYILHTIPLLICQLLFFQSTNFIINSLLAVGCILGTWALLKIPGINRIVPR